MTFALARSLLLADALKPPVLADALLFAGTRGTSLVVALLASRALDPLRLEPYLENSEVPFVPHVSPVLPLTAQLPPDLCERLFALPVHCDLRTGAIDVAVVDPGDSHPLEEMAHWLRAPVRMVRTSIASMQAGLQRVRKPLGGTLRSLAPPMAVSPAEVPASYRVLPDRPIDILPDDPPGDLPPNIPFALTRRTESDSSSEARTDPVLDLFRRKNPPSSGELDAPSTARGPFPGDGSATAPADFPSTLEAMAEAPDRDAVLALVLAATESVARRVAVFAIKRELLVGWTCSRGMATKKTIRETHMGIAPGSVFETALRLDEAMLFALPDDAAHAPLRTAMSSAGGDQVVEIAVSAIRIDKKPVALLIADQWTDPHVVTARLQQVATAAGEALARVLRSQRK